MSPTLKKFLITSGFAALVVSIGIIVSGGQGPKTPPAQTPADGAASPAATAESGKTADAPAPGSTPADAANGAASNASTSGGAAAAANPAALTARVPAGLTAPDAAGTLGSLDPAQAPYLIEFAPTGAGISRIVFADFWKTVDASIAAKRARAANDPALMPADGERYVLTESRRLQQFDVPALAMRAVEVDGALVSLFSKVWASDPSRPGVFQTEIVDAAGTPVLRLTRVYTGLGVDPANKYLLGVVDTIENLDGKPHAVRLVQYGPGDSERDPNTLTEARRYHFGYLYPPERDPSQSFVTANGQMFERGDVLKRIAANDLTLWPNTASTEGRFGLVWYGITDRYFSFTVHSNASDSKLLSSVAEVRVISNGEPTPNDVVFATLWSPVVTVEAASRTSLSMGVYAGPLDPKVLEGMQPYESLGMGDLIVYLMAGCCSWCTFSWLADFLLWFLTFIHDYLVFDWGLAIIALVVVVRLILHPVQKKSQISMQRFSRAMTAMKPELDALQKKFKDDPSRMQQEQMRLFREKGVSPAGCVGGLLPTFAQMPIWMALYAVLYFAFPLRHQAPFFGLFQSFGDWSFLADLSAQDNFIKFGAPIDLFLFSLSSINLLPILMGIVFWFQQQYMTPPTPNMSEEQIAQQKMMKWMMVLMFPIMMYVVPSGLTLYILTSTCIGIVEGRIIKKQVDAMDLTVKPTARKKKDFLGRMYEQALERAKQRDQQKKFKER
jgi:YidC/Oxa1 family membrane protein insertase